MRRAGVSSDVLLSRLFGLSNGSCRQQQSAACLSLNGRQFQHLCRLLWLALGSLIPKSCPQVRPTIGRRLTRPPIELITEVIYGGQTNKYDFHYRGYSKPLLTNLLLSIGFRTVEPFEKSSCLFIKQRDAADATIAGTPISLNLCATK